MKKIITHHFVKTEDLNHHGTLYAGRTAEWFVEVGLMAAQDLVPETEEEKELQQKAVSLKKK